jgi:hypothetical protein
MCHMNSARVTNSMSVPSMLQVRSIFSTELFRATVQWSVITVGTQNDNLIIYTLFIL